MLLEIGLSLLVARILHIFFDKIKQPAVIGEILAGILLGPYVGGLLGINVLSGDTKSVFEGLAKMGIVLLLFISGLETGIEELKGVGRKGLITSFFDAAVAFIFGFLAGKIIGLGFLESIAIGNILVATSVGVTVKTLLDMEKLHTRIGEMILTVAVLDDVFGIIVLSISLGTEKSIIRFLSSEASLTVAISVIIFFALIFLSIRLIDLLKKTHRLRLYTPQLIITSSLSIAFIYAAIAKCFGLAEITGSFFAGLIVSKLAHKDRIKDIIRTIADYTFVPFFFVWVGASFDFTAIGGGLGLVFAVMIPMALIGKVIGCSIGSRICGYTPRESLAVGVGMMPRMEVALIVVTTELTMDVFSSPEMAHQVLGSTILLTIISSLITPPLLKIVYPQKD